MSPRRLPLAPPASTGSLEVEVVPCTAPPRAVVVGDTGDGELALNWAACLVSELVKLGRSAKICVVGFEAGLLSRGSRQALFSRASGLREIALPSLHEPQSELATEADERWVLAGPAALLAFAGGLPVLVGADKPLLRWPEWVRRSRPRVSLELAGPGLAVARALAHELDAGWA